jgi:hypothetical protein
LQQETAMTAHPPLLLGAANPTVLDFDGEWQQQTQWCWAAACASISRYYQDVLHNGREKPQCEIVQQVIGFRDRDCCADPGACNVQGPMDAGLVCVGHFRRLTDGPVPLSEIRTELQAGRPVGVRVILANGAEHIVVIFGCDDNAKLHVWNPARGYIATDMSNWTAHVGWWQNTCFTQEDPRKY